MWRSADGVLQTVALPDPRPVFSARALQSIEVLVADEGAERLLGVLEAAELDLVDHWGSQVVELEAETSFKAVPAPDALVDAPITGYSELFGALDQIDPRWRLDVVLAMQDLIDDLLPD